MEAFPDQLVSIYRGMVRGGVSLLNSRAWHKSFPTTMWTQIIRAKQGHEIGLNEFYRRYAHTCFYCYFRAKRIDSETAKDLTQDLFVKLSNGKLLGRLKPRRHRFRSFLRQVACNQWKDYWKKQHCELERRIRPLDEALDTLRPHQDPSNQFSPELAFERRSAQALLDEAIRRVNRECRDHALEDHFLIFADRHLGDRCLKWDQIGKRHGVSGQKASNMARTVEDRFRRVLRDLIRPECRYASEIEEEIRGFIAVFKTPTNPEDDRSDAMETPLAV